MRIAHVLRSLDPATGGVASAVMALVAASVAQGHQLTLITLDPLGAPGQAQAPAAVIALGPAVGGYGWTRKLGHHFAAHAADYDVVVIHGLWQWQGFGTWRAIAGRLPYVVYPHGMLDPWFRQRYPLKHLKKKCYWRFAEHRILRDAAAVVFTAQDECTLAHHAFDPWIANSVVAPLGVAAPPPDPDAQRHAFIRRWPALADTTNFLFLGRLHEKKGVDLLLSAFAECAKDDQRLRLVYAGPDQENWQPRLEKIAAALGCHDRLVFTGLIHGAEKWGALRCAAALVLPSHQENFGMVVAEALACGVPALISQRVNIWREIIAGQAGLASNDDAAGVLALLRNFLALTREQRHAMSAQAQILFNHSYHINRATAAHLALLRDALDVPEHSPSC